MEAMSAEDVLFKAVVVPHRSLSRRGLRRLLAVIGMVCAVNLASSARLHAWPIFAFAGLELLLAVVLLCLNARAARQSELLVLTPAALRIVRTDPRGQRKELVFSPAWLRVDLEERAGRVPALWLAARGVREEVGQTLGEAQKRDLARALGEALYRLRHPVFHNPQLG
jgi:uncharacterized membrane protein